MSPEAIPDLIFRWIHVGTAIVLVGGTIFMRFVLMPAADKLPGEAHDTLRDALTKRWKWFVHLGVALLLISGLYNYIKVGAPGHRGDKLYNALLGVKMLLALILFVLAEAMVGRSETFAKLRQNRKKWLAIMILLALIIVAISGYAKIALPPTK